MKDTYERSMSRSQLINVISGIRTFRVLLTIERELSLAKGRFGTRHYCQEFHTRHLRTKDSLWEFTQDIPVLIIINGSKKEKMK